MKKLTTKWITLALTISFFALGLSATSAMAGVTCMPQYTQETYKKVFRSHKIYFDGLADLNNDGKLDAYGYQLQPNNTYKNIVYVLNNGAGGFGDPVVINTPEIMAVDGADRQFYNDREFHAVNVGHLNNDGILDFVIRTYRETPGGYNRNLVGVYSGGGTYTVGSGEVAIAPTDKLLGIADLNSDGKGDLIVYAGNMFFVLGDGVGGFGDRQPIGVIREQVSAVIDDFNGDSIPDIAYGHNISQFNGTLRVFINNGSAVFTERTPVITDYAHQLTGAADINGDGKKDLYGRSVYLNDGAGNFTKASLPGTPTPDYSTSFYAKWDRTLLMDYDGDGRKDLVYGITGQTQRYGMGKKFTEIYGPDNTNTVKKNIVYRPFIGYPADMNGDGKDEEIIFVQSNKTSPEELSYMPRLRMSGSNEAAIIVRENVCTPPPVQGQTRLIDFDGDNVSDLALWNSASGQWRYSSSRGDGGQNWGGGAFGDTPAPGDFDGDGKTDLAVFRNPTGDWWILKSSDSTIYWNHFGATGDIPIPADYNGDGKTDMGVFRPSLGDWYIDYSDNPNYVFLHFGATGDIPIPADYDGDGADNICVFRPSNGSWYYLTPTFDNYVGAPWGMAGDIPIPADYDMDGKADFAIYRPSLGGWYIFRSYDYGFDYVPFKFEENNIPMVIDSDGDGVVELATYSPPQGSRTVGWWWTTSRPSSRWNETWLWAADGGANDVPLRIKTSNQ